MRTLVLLAVSLLCSLASPPSVSAGPPTCSGQLTVREFKATPAPAVVAETTATPTTCPVLVLPVMSAETYLCVVVAPNAAGCGALLQHCLSISGTALRVRPGWRGSVGSAFTEYKAAGLRCS